MIRKLQKKFIMITMASLAVVVFILLGAINIVSYYEIDSKMNGLQAFEIRRSVLINL